MFITYCYCIMRCRCIFDNCQVVKKDFSELDLPISRVSSHSHSIGNNMESEVSTVAQVERFEDYYLRKRSPEVDIELALIRRDVNAVKAIELAELEVERTKSECADPHVRVKAGLEGNFERAEKSGLPSESRRTTP